MSRPSTLKKILGIAAMFVAGAAVGALAARGVLQSSAVRESLQLLSPWDLLAMPLLWLLVVAVHEAGHLLPALAQRMPFLVYVVGPLGWFRAGDRVRFRWCFKLGTLGGMAAGLPDAGRPLAAQMMPVVLGGPLASLLLAGVAALVHAQADPGRLAAYALAVALLSGLVFLTTAVPLRAGGFMSDGLQWLAYRRGGADVERRARLTALMGQSLAGTRPRELDPALLAQAQAGVDEQDAMTAMGVWLYSHAEALDRGDPGQAAHWARRMAAALDAYPDGFRQAIRVELAIFDALHRQDLEAAQAWLADARGGIVETGRRQLAVAAVASLQGNHAAARRALDQAMAWNGQAMDAGYAHLGQDQIEGLARRLADHPRPQPA